nr:amidase [Nocardioidaceae bacterium]
ASVCGLVGVKPSRGRVSAAPLYGDVSGLSTSGPLATTVRDAAALLDAMAGPAVGDPAWATPLPVGESYLDWCDRTPGRLRVARFVAPPIGDGQVDPEVLEGYERASRLLADLGHEIEDFELPLPAETLPVFEVVWSVGTASWPVDPEHEHELRPLSRWLRERGRATTAVRYVEALVGMRQAAAVVLGALAPYDAVLTPTLAQPPVLVGSLRNDADPAADFEAQKRFTPFTALWNVTGMPAVSLPLHWTRTGLPVGIMLGAAPGRDHRLLALAAQIEQACAVDGRWPHPATPFTAPRA